MSSDESYLLLELWENKNIKCSKGVRKDVKCYCIARKKLNRCIKGRLDMVLSVLDSCSLVQEALCACSEGKKKERLSQWGFCCLSWKQQKHKKHWLTNTWPLWASNTSALHLIQCQQMPPLSSIVAVSSQSTRLFHVFIKATVFWADIWVNRFGLHSLSADSLLTEGLKAVQNTSTSLVLKNCCKQSCVLVGHVSEEIQR